MTYAAILCSMCILRDMELIATIVLTQT
jgi:hypothetical protein